MSDPAAPLSDALEIEDVAIVRGGRLLLSGAAFAAPPGAFIALRGPNGSGKTSLLRALCGLAPIARGVVRYGETSLAEDPEAYREKVLLGGHLDAVKANLTVRENLAFWTRFYGASAADAGIDAALRRFGLDALADAPAGHCSAGQKRRLGLARLAAAERPVWILDEPTVSLDAASTENLSALIAEHCRAGGIAIAATHLDFPMLEGRTVDVSAFRPTAATARAAAEDPFLAGFDEGG